jgi:hypothetical protein
LVQRIHRVGEIIHDVGILHSVIGLIVLVTHSYFLDEITSSHTLQTFIVGGATLGGPVGFFRTAFVWGGKGRPACRRRGLFYFVLWAFLLLWVIAPIEIMRPMAAEKIPLFANIREWLLTFMIYTDFLIFFAAFLSSFFLIGAITLCSAKLANPRKTPANP